MEASVRRSGMTSHFTPMTNYPGGDKSENVNPFIPTQTPEEDLSDHMQSPG